MNENIYDQIEQLLSTARQLFQAGNYQTATESAEEARNLAFRHYGKYSLYADATQTLAALHYQLGNYRKAEPFFREALEIFRETLSPQHPEYAANLCNLAVLCQKLEKSEEAESLYLQALEIRRATVGEGSPVFATNLNNLAKLYQDRGDFETAEPLLQQALQIVRDSVIEEGPSLARAMISLGELYQAMGNYEKAQPLVRQAVEMMEKSDSGHPDFAGFLSHLGYLNKGMGQYQAAERQYLRAIQIADRLLGKEHPLYGAIGSRLGDLYFEKGDYEKAESHFLEVKEISLIVYGAKHTSYATALSNLAALYFVMADYERAEQLFQEALEIKRTALGENHPDFAGGLRNMATVLDARRDTHKSDLAERYYLQALEICKATLGEKNPQYSNLLNDLGILCDRQHRYGEAVRYFRQARDIWLQIRGVYGMEHPRYAAILNNLAGAYDAMGIYAAAEQYYQEACEIQFRNWGENHPSYLGCLKNLAGFYVAINRVAEAIPMMRQVMEGYDRLIGQVFAFTSENQKMIFLENLRDDYYSFLSLALSHAFGSEMVKKSALDLVLRRKALVAESSLWQRAEVLRNKHPELAPKLQEITTLREQLAQKTLAGAGKENLSTHQQLLAELNAEKERLEAELARQIPEINMERKLRSIDRQVVAMALPAEAVLIEFVRFDVFDFKAVPARGEKRWKSARYLAFVMQAGEPDRIEMLDLGEAEPIDQMIVTFREIIMSEAEDSERGLGAMPKFSQPEVIDVGKQLCNAVFLPLLKAIGEQKRLLISLDGDLTQLPFEVLPFNHQQRLIDKYHISYLSAGRDVVRFGFKSNRQPARALVAADPNFDLWAKMMPVESSRTTNRRSHSFDEMKEVTRLENTRLEGEHIAAMLKAELWTEDKVLDARLKKCQSPSVLHLATHGFFLEDRKRDLNQDYRGLGAISFSEAGAERKTKIENPLLRSGLLLAGYNTYQKTHQLMEEAEDGLLTADDVSGMDLLDTELVVLSACETGLGEVRVGEGVFGLQRAFVLAGAKTLVMSLWEVPDEQTRELMEDFYRRILGTDGKPPQPRAEALRQAQLMMKAKYPAPFYWGAFICQGYDGLLN